MIEASTELTRAPLSLTFMGSADVILSKGDQLEIERAVEAAPAIKAKNDENENMLASDDALAGVIKRGAAATREKLHKQKELDKKAADRRTSDTLLLLQLQHQGLLEDLAQLQNDAEKLQEEINQIDQELMQVRGEISTIKDALSEYDETGTFKLDAEGNLANPELERLLFEYEKENGPIDRNDPSAIYDALESISAEKQVRQTEVEGSRQDKQRELGGVYGKIDEKRKEIEEVEVKLGEHHSHNSIDEQSNQKGLSSDEKDKLADLNDWGPEASNPFNTAAEDKLQAEEPEIESEPLRPETSDPNGPGTF